MKITEKKTHSHVKFTHIEQNSSRICVMLSGSGYSYDKPLFYYSTMALLQEKMDIVHIHYSYGNDLFQQPLDYISEIIVNDVQAVLTEVSQQYNYSEWLFIGKSLGTIPIIQHIMHEPKFNVSKMILLTPLLKFDELFNRLQNGNQKCLIVIGNQDPHYNKEKIDQLFQKENISIEVIDNANHSLDVIEFNSSSSIQTLDVIIKKISQFCF